MFDNGIDKIKQLLSDYFSKTPLGQTIGQATKMVDQYIVDPLASRNDQFRYRENAPQGVTDLNMARKYNPQLFKQYEQGTITGPQMDEILRTGRVQEWAPQQAQPIAQDYETTPEVNPYMDPTKTAATEWGGEVLGKQQQAVQQPIKNQVPSKIPTYTEEQKSKAINYFLKNAGTVKPDSPNRSTPEKAQANVEYVQEYLNEIFKQAPQFNLDPMMITAIAAQESGWGGTRHGQNLLGSGVFDDGTDLDRAPEGVPLAEAVGSLLKSISEDWGGIYQNKTTPEGFVEGKYKWNVHPSWVRNVGIIRNNLN